MSSSSTRVDSLDILRGVAALLVFGYHFIHVFGLQITSPWLIPFAYGWVGVHLFYVLSGFFITVAVVAPNEFSFRRFMVRRVARIVPAYYLSIAVIVLLTHSYFITNLHGLYHLVMNLSFLHHFDFETMGSINGAYWTLGVEWFFYLSMATAAPLLRGRWFWHTLATAVLFSWAWRTGVFLYEPMTDLNRFYYSGLLPGALDEFAFGAVVAGIYIRRKPDTSISLARCQLTIVGGALLYLLALLTIHYSSGIYWRQWWTVIFLPALLAAGFGLLVHAFTHLEKYRWLHILARNSGMAYIGKVSFGIYIWHIPVLKAIAVEKYQYSHPLPLLLLGFIGVMVMASLSYYLVEDRFHPSR